jgi:hypothetical protein
LGGDAERRFRRWRAVLFLPAAMGYDGALSRVLDAERQPVATTTVDPGDIDRHYRLAYGMGMS